jgi:hypothetical protein
MLIVIDAFFTEQDPTIAEGATRLADDIIDYFRKQAEDPGGGNYQTAINQALPDCIESAVVRKPRTRMVREEFGNI